MGKINDYTRKFSGRLAGTTIGELGKRLDYKIDNLQDRITLVEEICQHDFFVEYFDVKDKTVVDHNHYISGYDEKIEELKIQRDYLIKEANQCIMQYKKTRDMELIEMNEKLKEQAMDIDEVIEQMKINKEKEQKDVAGRIYFNVHPKCYSEVYSGDPLGADNNVCQTLERMADYILKMDEEYKAPSERQIKKVKYIESSLDCIMENKGDIENVYDYNSEKYTGNFKVEIKQRIHKEDLQGTKVDKKRKDKKNIKVRMELLTQMKEAVDQLTVLRENTTGKKYFIDKAIGELNFDMISIKDSYNGTIYFKRIMKDTCDMQEWLIDFRDIHHIKALLECKPSSQKWYGCTSMALEQYLYDIRKKITKEDWDDLQFIRECANIGYTKLFEETGISREQINPAINRIAKLIYRHHMEVSEDLWYLNMVKSQWKKCSKCGEIKIIKRFNKESTGQYGVRGDCKECENSRKLM